MLASTREFLTRIAESGLSVVLPPEMASALLTLPTAEAAARELIAKNLLTEFQAKVIVNGESIPLIIGDYVVLGALGRGGMGYVLKARHRRMKRDVAIKLLLKELTASDDMRRRFEREVEAAAQLNHQNIVTAYDAGEHTDGSCYLVMQFVDGEDLSHYVKSKGPLTVLQAVNVICQAAEGLAFAHDQGIVHRDIKPGNLLLDKNGVVRILDMGLARMRPAPGDSLQGGAHADLTNTGSVMGTIDYMAPEQALDAKSADHRADIYSLGCTLWFLLSGNPPYREDTIMRRLLAHREQQIPSIRSLWPEAPSELDEIFQRMMAKTKDDRFPSMQHLIVALRGLDQEDLEASQMATLDVGDESPSSAKRPLSGTFTPPSSRTAPLPLSDLQTRGAKPAVPSGTPTEATVIQNGNATSETVTFNNNDSQIAPAPQLATSASASFLPPNRNIALTKRVALMAGLSAFAIALAVVIYGPGKPASLPKDDGLTKNGPISEARQLEPSPEVASNHKPEQAAPAAAKAPFDTATARQHQEGWAKHLNTTVETTNSVGAKMVLIPPGQFQMGSTPEEIANGLKIVDAAKMPAEAFERSRIPEEQPQHAVTITRPFCISATEVTVAQFRRFIDETKYWTQGEQFGSGNSNTWTAPKDVKPEAVKVNWRSPGYPTTDQHPVTQVTWGDAITFCNWLSEQELLEPCYESDGKLNWKLIPSANGYRLPTEAEWEYACRAGTTTQFSFGDNASQINEYGWSGESRPPHPQPVANKLPNPFGLYDMHGNVREWCYDWYSSEFYAESSQVDPTGSEFGTDRVMRGGRWSHHSVNSRSAFRYDINPFLRNTQGGFRIVRAPLPPPTATDILIAPDYEWSSPENLGPAVNSKQSDTNPFISADGLTLLFASNRAQGQSGFDLWEAQRSSVSEAFQPATNLARVVNSFATDNSPCLSADGLQLVFASDRPGSEGDLDLYLCRRSDPQSKWGPPENLKSPINTSDREDGPAFSPDGLTLYFASNRSNGHGGVDIWSARRVTLNTSFGEPKNLGPLVNSPDQETHFRLLSDGRSAVLSRSGSNNQSSTWLTLRRTADGSFLSIRPIHPLGAENVTAKALSISPDGRELYFQSRRSGGQGEDDLWLVRRVMKPKPAQPTKSADGDR